MLKTTYYYKQLAGKKAQCTLCPHNCIIRDGKAGICQVRKNVDGHIQLTTYNQITALHIDPIEKKPLYHFYPNRNILSVGNLGCNLNCKFCQNWELANCEFAAKRALAEMPAENAAMEARNLPDNIGLAFTYNEPIVWYEYMYDIASSAKKTNAQTVAVTNGYINQQPLDELINVIDAFSIDLKAFTEQFYKKLTKSTLQPVLNTIKQVYNAGKHLEVTNLVIPGYNDSPGEFREMMEWLVNNTDKDTPVHISRYLPAYKMQEAPTSPEKLKEFYGIAREYMNYVFLGNISINGTSDTYCKNCDRRIIKRSFYSTDTSGIDKDGKCIYCGEKNINFI